MNGKEIQQTNRSRNKCGMTEFCHCEVPKARQRVRHWWNLSCHLDVLAEEPQEKQPRPRISNTRKLVLKFNPAVMGVSSVSKAHSKELNVLKSYRLNDFKKKVAFTLAEVLITLGIIGIVAAMTIPTLISNYKSVQLQSQLKKTYSSLSQAVNMIHAESGLPVTPARYAKAGSFYKDLMKYMKVAKDCGGAGCLHWGEVGYVFDEYLVFSKKAAMSNHFLDDGQFILQDGTLVMCENPINNTDAGLLITADINGTEKGPNAWGHDLFTFEVQDSRLVPSGAKGTHFDLELYPNYCSETSSSGLNGIACTEKALTSHDYFKNLPK